MRLLEHARCRRPDDPHLRYGRVAFRADDRARRARARAKDRLIAAAFHRTHELAGILRRRRLRHRHHDRLEPEGLQRTCVSGPTVDIARDHGVRHPLSLARSLLNLCAWPPPEITTSCPR